MEQILARVQARVAERFPADLERIRDYLRMPSVSATGDGIRAVAEATGAWIEGAGGSFELVETPGPPRGGPAIDLHSSEQAWIASPVWALVQALAILTDADEGIRVAGLDGGPGGKTIVPSRAMARVDIRLVGGDPEAAAAAVRRHLDDHGFGHVQTSLLDAYPWARAEPGNRSEVAMRASHQALGRTPLPYPLAPWCAPYFVFDRILGLPWASGGVGHAAGAHGPDEYATLAGREEHIDGAAAFLLAYAGLPEATP
jgi:acetylornithine deacetylase/succinyl-diaminopimelate desuccinylase-like protein